MADTAVAPAPAAAPNPILANLASSLKLKDPSAWAADPVYDNTVNQINQGLAGLQSSSDLSKQRTNEDYTTGVKSLADTNQQNNEVLQNRLANQGIGYSGINVKATGDLASKYQDAQGQLSQNKQRSLEDITRDFTTKQSDYANQMSAAEAARADRESTRETNQAADEAAATAATNTANQTRQWITDLTAKITGAVQPTATPTGALALPNTNPTAVVQQALAQVPPPAAKTPAQQIQESGIDPKLLQSTLAAAGYSPGPIDGVVGIKTQQALARMKQSLGLPATADMTPDIWAKIQGAMLGPQNAPAPLGGNAPMTSAQQTQAAQQVGARVQANPNANIPQIGNFFR